MNGVVVPTSSSLYSSIGDTMSQVLYTTIIVLGIKCYILSDYIKTVVSYVYFL